MKLSLIDRRRYYELKITHPGVLRINDIYTDFDYELTEWAFKKSGDPFIRKVSVLVNDDDKEYWEHFYYEYK